MSRIIIGGALIAASLAVGPAAFANNAGGGPGGITPPAAIDRAIASFTGQQIGQTGGAIAPVDERLRLARCASPLALDWYGSPGRTVSVACPGPGGWRIFVNVRAAAQSAPQAIAIRRGEAVTIAFRGRGFTVQQRGEARGNGAVGEWIEVRVDRRSPTIRARVVRPGLVVIENG